MKQADYNRLEDMIARAQELAVQVLNGDEASISLAEEVSGECSELLALMDGDMGAFGQPELIDPKLRALARALQPRRSEMKSMQLDRDMLLQAAKCMETEGGSFAGHIARAFYVADTQNAEALLTAFDGLFIKFYAEHCRNERRKEREASK